MPKFQVSYLLQKGNDEARMRSYSVECGNMNRDMIFRQLASRYARNPHEENKIVSQLKFSGMASIGRGRGIKHISFTETATPLPFTDFLFGDVPQREYANHSDG